MNDQTAIEAYESGNQRITLGSKLRKRMNQSVSHFFKKGNKKIKDSFTHHGKHRKPKMNYYNRNFNEYSNKDDDSTEPNSLLVSMENNQFSNNSLNENKPFENVSFSSLNNSKTQESDTRTKHHSRKLRNSNCNKTISNFFKIYKEKIADIMYPQTVHLNLRNFDSLNNHIQEQSKGTVNEIQHLDNDVSKLKNRLETFQSNIQTISKSMEESHKKYNRIQNELQMMSECISPDFFNEKPIITEILQMLYSLFSTVFIYIWNSAFYKFT